MSNRQVYQLTPRTLALTDVVPTQDTSGNDELGINTIQDIGNAVSPSIVTAAATAVANSNVYITTGSAGASQSLLGNLNYSGQLIGGDVASTTPPSLAIYSNNSDLVNIQGTGSYITLVNTNRISGQTSIASVFRTTSGGDYKTKGKLRFDFGGNVSYVAYENAANTTSGSHTFYTGGDSGTGSILMTIGNSLIDTKRGLTVSGSTNLSGSLTTVGATSIGSTLSVTGTTTLTGATTLGSGLTVTGSTVLSGSSVSITGTLSATDVTTFGNGLTVTGSTLITGSLVVTGPATITDVLVLPFQSTLPSGSPTASIALSGSGGTFEGMYVYNGTAWTKVGP